MQPLNITGNLEDTEKFNRHLNLWLDGFRKIYNDYMDAHFPNNTRENIVASQGKRYIKIKKIEPNQKYGSVCVFIDTINGDVYKSASHAAPAKHARGNIFDEHNGLKNVTWHGPAYLRG